MTFSVDGSGAIMTVRGNQIPCWLGVSAAVFQLFHAAESVNFPVSSELHMSQFLVCSKLLCAIHYSVQYVTVCNTLLCAVQNHYIVIGPCIALPSLNA